jgi:hypothetical protein
LQKTQEFFVAPLIPPVKIADFTFYLYYSNMLSHPKQVEFDAKMNALFAEVDGVLEDVYGGEYPLHPVRPSRGVTENPEADGLFEVTPDFTAGYGSTFGRGYLVRTKLRTLEAIPVEVREQFRAEAAQLVAARLPKYFPERVLEIVRDGESYKIVGDFSLGDK